MRYLLRLYSAKLLNATASGLAQVTEGGLMYKVYKDPDEVYVFASADEVEVTNSGALKCFNKGVLTSIYPAGQWDGVFRDEDD
jgi:hypothetical protein